MNDSFGPFSVDPAQVAGLSGGLFQELAGRLLDIEGSSAGMAGIDVHTSFKVNAGDQGVDAGFYAAVDTEWMVSFARAAQGVAGPCGRAKDLWLAYGGGRGTLG
jgi:hypothetical protein